MLTFEETFMNYCSEEQDISIFGQCAFGDDSGILKKILLTILFRNADH